MSLLKVNEIQVFNGTTVTITATTAITSADLTVTDDLDVGGALTLGTALAIAEGGTGATTASAARTALDVDQAGTDNSTDVTLAGSLDYITISGQEITRNAIDLTTDVTGTLPIANGGTNSTTASAARIALGLEIGTDVQSYDADTTKNDVSNTFSANQIISVESASAALRITQTGAGNALVVEDTTNPDSTPFVINAVGQVGIGTDSPTEKFDVDGNINASGTLTLGTALAVAEGGTGVTALSSLDAADLGSSTATDGYVLTADGSGGAAWEAVSGGGGGGTGYIEHSDTVSDSLAISSGTNRLYVGGTTFSDSATMAGRLVVAGGHANFTGTMNFTGTLNVIG